MSRHRPRTLLALLCVFGLIAAACGNPGGDDEEGGGEEVTAENLPDCPVETLAHTTQPVNITFWYGGLGGKTLDTMKKIVDDYNASQDKVVVNAQDQGTSYEEVLRKYEGAARNQSIPSVVYLEATALRALIDSDTIVPAESCIQADDYDPETVSESVRAYYSTDGIQWPGYMNVSEPVLYFNRAKFEQAGLDPDNPPQNFAELRAAAEQLKASGVPFPLALSLKRWFVESWLTGAGLEVVDADNGRNPDELPTEANIANPTTLEILNWVKEMKADGLMQPIPNTPGNIDQYTALLDNSAMTLETSTASTTIQAFLKGEVSGEDLGTDGVPEVDTSDLAAAAGPFPGVEGPGKVLVAGGAFFLVNPEANNQDPVTLAASWDFLKYMLSQPVATEWHLEGGYLPVVEGVAEQPVVQEFWQNEVDGQMLDVAYQQLQTIDAENPGPLIGPYADYTAALEKMLDEVAINDGDPQGAMDEAQAEIDGYLEQYQEANG